MLDSYILDYLGEPIKVSIRVSKKSKRVGIKISHLGAELVLPSRTPLEEGLVFVRQKEPWIRKHAKYFNQEPIKKDDGKISILGAQYQLKLVDSERNFIQENNGILEIYSNINKYKIILNAFLKQLITKEINQLVINITSQYGFYFNKIQVKDLKSKWGSCSSHKNLSFNWRIVFAPKEVVRYLVVHEICHLKEMNHSKRFWNLVELIYPEYKIHKKWLKINGKSLYWH